VTPEELDYAVWPIFTQMTQRGLQVSIPSLFALKADIQRELAVQEEAARAMAGADFNPHSADQVRKWVVGAGLAGRKRTAKGAVATDERSLTLLAERHPLPGIILEARGLLKLVNTFVDPVIDLAVEGDGVVYPRWRLTKVRSGRPSCENPNLLAFPTRDKMGKRVRECFVARPGMKLISIDFSQIEPRVGAALSGDPALLRVFREKLDLYADMARRMFLGLSDFSDKQLKDDETLSRNYRQPAKVILLGAVMYGMGAKSLFDEFIKFGCGTPSKPNFSVEDCEDFVRRRFDPYPELGELVQRTVRDALAAGGWASTVGGRRRFLPALLLEGRRWPASSMRAEAERQAFNHLIQGTAQEIMKEAMLRVQGANLPVWPLLQIYDEMVYEVRADEAEDLRTELKRVMSTTFRDVAIVAGGSIAASWGGLK
jgi:DNA polymerase-1